MIAFIRRYFRLRWFRRELAKARQANRWANAMLWHHAIRVKDGVYLVRFEKYWHVMVERRPKLLGKVAEFKQATLATMWAIRLERNGDKWQMPVVAKESVPA